MPDAVKPQPSALRQDAAATSLRWGGAKQDEICLSAGQQPSKPARSQFMRLAHMVGREMGRPGNRPFRAHSHEIRYIIACGRVSFRELSYRDGAATQGAAARKLTGFSENGWIGSCGSRR